MGAKQFFIGYEKEDGQPTLAYAELNTDKVHQIYGYCGNTCIIDPLGIASLLV